MRDVKNNTCKLILMKRIPSYDIVLNVGANPIGDRRRSTKQG